MKKLIFLLLIFFNSFSFAENATKGDIKELSLQMRENNKLLIELIKSETKANRELIKSETKANRELIKANQEATNKRFEDMQKYMDKRFENMQNSMDKRFEQVDKRFEDMNSTLRLMMMVFGSLFGLMFLYLIKDRYSIKRDVQIELAKEFETQIKQKADKELLDRVVAIIEEMAKKDNFVKEILKKHNLILKT